MIYEAETWLVDIHNYVCGIMLSFTSPPYPCKDLHNHNSFLKARTHTNI